jgi:putative oxidoreductase
MSPSVPWGRARALASHAAQGLGWFPPLLARLAVGLVFAVSGWGKLHNLGQVTAFFGDLGIPAPAFNAALVAGTELVCGALVLVGVLSRLAALPLAGVMTVAILTARREDISSLTDLFGLMEFGFLVLLVWIAVAGPGPVALERLARGLARRSPTAA